MWAAKRSKMNRYDEESDQSFDNSNDFDEESSLHSENFTDHSDEQSDFSSNYEYDYDRSNDGAGDNVDETLIKNRLLKVLNNIANVGASEFAISGILSDAPAHAISIKRNGKLIRFPLYEDDLPSIIDVFKQSPYGKGTETIVDASFRNSWHLDPDDFVILNPKWNAYLTDVLVPRIQKEMAITTTFKASLYKLLLYKSGSFFKPHRDTEKEERMFGTLVIQLPSRFNGGQLVVEHDKKTKTIDFSSNVEAGNEFGTFFSSFYCDCKHEILPVSGGTRMCLVYNLVMDVVDGTSSIVPTAPVLRDIDVQLANICDEWKKANAPTKIVYGLSHKYTERSISLESLKSTDKVVAEALVKLSEERSLAVFLGTLEKTWEGDECFLREKHHEDDVQIEYRLKHLQMIGAPNVRIPKIKTMSVDHVNELIPKDCFRNLTPFDKQKEETGNEGTILTLSYRHSALVVYPLENIFNILIQEEGRSDEVKRIFIDECKKFESSGGDDDTKKKLLKWGEMFIPTTPWRREYISQKLLSAIVSLNDLPLLQKYLENHIFGDESIDAIVKLCDKFGWNTLSTQLMAAFKKLDREAALKVIDSIIGNPVDFVGKDEKRNVCLTLIGLLPTLNADNYQNPKAGFLYKFCVLAERVNYDPLNHLKAERVEMMVPVLVKLAYQTKNVLGKFWTGVAQHFLNKMNTLDTSTNQTPVWIRNETISCSCEDCVMLSAFMKKNVKATEFKIVKKRRVHLEKIVSGVAKLTFITESSGRPPKMVVSKTEPTSYTASEEQIVARKLMSKLTSILQKE